MIILTIRTDQPESELGLFEAGQKLAYSTWQADRQLAETIHTRIKELLDSQGLILRDIQGIAVFQGPGSFTGLRIGIATANALAYGLQVPIVGSKGEAWIGQAEHQLSAGQSDGVVVPKYGSPPHITQPKH